MRLVSKINKRIGEWLQWFVIAIIVVVLIDIIMRFIVNRPVMWTRDIVIMLACAMYVLSWADIERRNTHIRVDLIYERLSVRGKAIADLVSVIIFFLPLMLLLAYVSFSWAVESWRISEKSTETFWYPPLAPLRTIVFIAVCLYILQVIAQMAEYLRVIKNNDPDREESTK